MPRRTDIEKLDVEDIRERLVGTENTISGNRAREPKARTAFENAIVKKE